MDDFLSFFFGFILCVVLVCIPLVTTGFDSKYKEGQVDAINGKIKFELVTHEDKSQTWEKKVEK